MPFTILFVSQSDYIIQFVDTNSHTERQTVLKKPNDLDLHCFQRKGISSFSWTRDKRCLIVFQE